MKTALFTVVIGLCMAAIGHYVAAINIWWYHLESAQATLATWGYPILLGVMGAIYGFQLTYKRD